MLTGEVMRRALSKEHLGFLTKTRLATRASEIFGEIRGV